MLPVQCRMARIGLGIGIRDLAAAAEVGTATVSHFEAGCSLMPRTVKVMREALEEAGAIFIGEDGDDPGVRIKSKMG